MPNLTTLPRQRLSAPSELASYTSFQFQGDESESSKEGYRQSGLGIASLLLSVLIINMQLASICVAGFMEAVTPGGMTDDSPILILVVLFVLAGMIGNVVGIILAGVGLAQMERAKSVSLIGLSLNIMCLLGVVALMVLGTVAG